jgi:hypothetical protein
LASLWSLACGIRAIMATATSGALQASPASESASAKRRPVIPEYRAESCERVAHGQCEDVELARGRLLDALLREERVEQPRQVQVDG